MKLHVADDRPEDAEQTATVDACEATAPSATPTAPDAESRAATSELCRATVAGNDRVFAVEITANAIVLGFSLFLVASLTPSRQSAEPLIFVGWGLLIGSICLLLGGRYAGRASAKRHMLAQNIRRHEGQGPSSAEMDTSAHDVLPALRLERAQQRFATTYDWLIACAEALFVAGIICIAVFAALSVER